MYIKHINHIYPLLLSLFILPFPLVLTPYLTGPVLHFCLSLFKCIFIVQRDFALLRPQGTYCTLISLAPSITLLYSFLPPYYSIFLVHSSHIDTMYFSVISIILFSSPSFPFMPQSHYWKHFPHTHIWSCLYLHICLSLRSIFQLGISLNSYSYLN
jgi:hypothetical protein